MNDRTSFDPEQFKAATRESWDKAAEGWNEQTPQVHAWLTEATSVMLDQAGVNAGARVLDVAAGSGDQTLEIARRVGPTGFVLATDISPGILSFAIENARRAGFGHVEVKTADGERLGVDEASFDAAVSRIGLMFCPDPLQALREMHRALKPGGRASVMVFSEPQLNPCLGIVMSTALKHAGLPPANPYQPGGLLSLGKPGLLEELFGRAGFSEVTATRVSAVFRLPSAKDYVTFIRTSATPILQMLGRLDDAGRNAAWAEMEQKLGTFQTPDGWAGPNELLLGSGRR
jgi:ubiquinone/menaquinone biosynthesis C-methylase UbiE